MLKDVIKISGDNYPETHIARFLNVTELVEYSDKQVAAGKHAYGGNEDNWAGMGYREARHMALNGDDRFVPAAFDLLAAVDEALPPTSGFEIRRDVVGSRVNWADWMAGSPTPMRRRLRRHVESGEVQVWISFGPSASLGVNDCIKRGAAIMALIMKIQQYRPVQVWLYDETQTNNTGYPFYFIVGVDSRPLSLAHVGFAVSHPAFFRQPAIAAEYNCGARAGCWAPDMHQHAHPTPGMQTYQQRRDRRLGVNPSDVVLSSACDWNPLIKQPVEWIKAELVRIGVELEVEA